VRDLITPEQFDALYRPWADVMGDEICLLCRKVGHVITEPCNP
jgi:hypothetical protein